MKGSITNRLLHWAIALLGASCLGLVAHAENDREMPPDPTAAPAQQPIGTLLSFQAPAHFRRQAELVWQEVLMNMPFFRYDAVRTEQGGSARIQLINGSVLQLDPETLVILNPGSLKVSLLTTNVERVRDRAVVRSGSVRSETKNELWLLTSAALLRLKKADKSASAKLNLSVQEGHKLRVELVDGEGTVLKTSSPGKASVVDVKPLTPRSPIELDAPRAEEGFGSRESLVEWPDVDAATEPGGIEKPLEVTISSPGNYAEIRGANTLLTGRVSRGDTTLRINGNTVPYTRQLEFSARIPLSPGANAIQIQLIGRDGQSVNRRWTLIRAD